MNEKFKNNECHCNGGCKCKNCKCSSRRSSKCLKVLLVLTLGVVGLVLGVKFNKELSKAAAKSLKVADKKKTEYIKLSDKQIKNIQKVAKKLKK